MTFLINPVGKGQVPEKLADYLAQCRAHAHSPDSLRFYGQKMLALEGGMAKAEGWFAVGYAAYQEGNFDQAAPAYRKALAALDSTEAPVVYARILRNLGIALRKGGRAVASVAAFKRLLALARAQGDSMLMGRAYNEMGLHHRLSGQFEVAMENFRQALTYQESQHYPGVVNVYTNIALVYDDMDQDSLAGVWFRKAYRKARKEEVVKLEYRTLNNLGNYYRLQGKLDSAFYYQQKVAEFWHKLPPRLRSLHLQNQAELLLKLNWLSRADSFYREAWAQLPRKENSMRRTELYSVGARLALAQENYDTARQRINNVLRLAVQFGQPLRQAQALLIKSKIAEMAGNTREALKLYKQYARMEDSLAGVKTQTQVRRLLTEYEVAQREEELATLQKSHASWQRASWLSLLLAFLLAGAGYIFYRRYRSTHRSFTSSQEKLDQTRERLENLQNTLEAGPESDAPQQIRLKSKALIELNQLEYLESEGHYIHLYLQGRNRPEVERSTLKSMLEQLPKDQFLQVHRSYAINTRFIKALYANRILTHSGKEIPVSRTFKDSLKALHAND